MDDLIQQQQLELDRLRALRQSRNNEFTSDAINLAIFDRRYDSQDRGGGGQAQQVKSENIQRHLAFVARY